MAHPLSRHAWVLNLVVIAACALLASKALGRLVETRLPVINPKVTTPTGHPQIRQSTRDVSGVTGRNIFCSTCAPEPETKPVATDDPDVPAPTALELKLLATLVSEDTTSSPSYAAITVVNSTAFYGVGAKVKGALIVSISERRVTLLNGGRLEVLDLLKQLAPAARQATLANVTGFKMPRAQPGLQRIARGIRKVGQGKYEIQRKALKLALSSPHVMAKGAQVIPVVKGGKPSGIMLRRVRAGSVYSLLGMFSGDTITAINGRALTSPEVALQLYTRLRSASHFSVAFKRRGKPLSHDYVIR